MSSAVHLVEYNNQFFSIFAAVAAVVLRQWFYGGRAEAVVLRRCVVIKQFEYLMKVTL